MIFRLISNVETHVASAYELPLEDESVDRAFLVTVLPEIPDGQRALAELRPAQQGGPGSAEELPTDYVNAEGIAVHGAKERLNH